MDPSPITAHPADQLSDPSPPNTTNNLHPPYAEMIIAAISALKDKDGSSRQAISKYIEKEFINLPPTHATLLTHHLKRLKNQGQLIMVKHSYMLPPPLRSVSAQSQFQSQPPGYHTTTLDFTNNNNVTDASSNVSAAANANANANFENSPKRKPGRPPKLKPVPGLGLGVGVQQQMPNVQPYDAAAAAAAGDVSSYQPQYQDLQVTYGSASDFQGNSGGGGGGGSEPLFASLGLGDDGVAAVQSPPPTENTAVVKRGRGRPPKNGGGGGANSEGDVAGQIEGSGRLLRKPKMMSVMMGGNGVRVKRGRGRPKRIGMGGPVTVPLSGNVSRPRGRPKRLARSNNAGGVNANGGGGGGGENGLGKRRPGRPSVNKIARFNGKPLGRPSKSGHGTAVLVTDPRQLVVYQELKNKYELLQSKVKEVASVVKTCIDPDYGNAALEALQELEALAGEVNASSHGQTQEEPTPTAAPAPFLQN